MKRTVEMTNNDTQTADDFSILRKPIRTSLYGLLEIIKAYEGGTDELRRLLTLECTIIIECRACLNLFRGLPNFLSHKRIYCKNTFAESLQYDLNHDGKRFSQDISTIVHAEEQYIGAVKSHRTSDKDLSSIVDRLIKREKANRLLKLSDFYEQVSNKLTQDQQLQSKHVLHLDMVPESKVAVYQTVKDEGAYCDNIKSEVMEIQDICDQNHTVLGPDGKIVTPAELAKFLDFDSLERPFECEICKTKFATEKTLKLHIETKHITSTYVYQCPSPACSKTFLQVGQVIRHLTNDHKKSMKRVRMMRDSILKRRTRMDEVQVKGPSRELARLQTDKVECQNKAWIDNLEDNENSGKNICVYCGRQFDRRAVLLSHDKVCQQKKKPNTRISQTRKGDQERVNGWNEKELDDSSNSNSLDGAEDVSKSSKFVKNGIEIEQISSNRRKRGRVVKAIVDGESEDEQMNMYWNSHGTTKTKEESVSPVDETNVSDSGSNNTGDVDTRSKTSHKIDEPSKEEKRTRASNGASSKVADKPTKKLSTSYCKYCFKKFSNASNLRRHMTTSHFGPKKFTCTLCSYRARRNTDIFNHMRNQHQFSGERIDAMKFIANDDEAAPKPPPSSVNRRKDKHTEVLRDDEEEIFIDSEAFFGDEPSEPVTFGASNDNSSAEMEDASNSRGNSEHSKSSLKRKGRPRTVDKSKMKKSERTSSPEFKDSESLPGRRPVRNRVMPVKKDFVYDLSTLIKKEYKDFGDELQKQSLPQPIQPQPQPTQVKSRTASPTPETKTNRRRHVPDIADSSESELQPNLDDAKVDIPKLPLASLDQKDDNTAPTIVEHDENTIKGAAEAMAQKAVKTSRAVFFKPPELPSGRPNTTQRHFETSIIKAWPILKRPQSIPKLPNSKGSCRKKHICALKHAGIKCTNRKCKLHILNGHSEYRFKSDLPERTPETIASRLADKMQLQCALVDDESDDSDANEAEEPTEVIETDPEASTSTVQSTSTSPSTSTSTFTDTATSSSAVADSTTAAPIPSTSDGITSADITPTTPRRVTMFERLAENKKSKRGDKLGESLFRESLANSDNDSDED